VSQWFSYRKRNRERPIIGDRRPPSKLGVIQPDHWLAEYTTELASRQCNGCFKSTGYPESVVHGSDARDSGQHA
jgi:hypothetical protein